jgi:hypothetical protein
LAPPAVLPAAPLAATLNARFNRDVTKFASLEAGVLIHQLDGFQDAELPWAPCSGSSRSHNCQGTRTSSRRHRVSCSVIFAGLHRKDASIPTFSVDAGVVLRPSMANVLCGYGNDGSIDDNRPLMCEGGYPYSESRCVPGCGSPPAFCDPRNPHDEGSWTTCGVSWGAKGIRPWRGVDLPGMAVSVQLQHMRQQMLRAQLLRDQQQQRQGKGQQAAAHGAGEHSRCNHVPGSVGPVRERQHHRPAAVSGLGGL